MKEFKDFKEVKISKKASVKLVGGNGGDNQNEDGTIIRLGTIHNDGDG